MAERVRRDAAAKARRDGRKAIAQARPGGRRVWLWLATGAVVAAAVAAVVVIVMTPPGQRSTPTESASLNNPPATVAVGADALPPWPAPADAAAAAAAAGLPMLGSEGNVEHLHAHLDVLVDDRPVAVPANVGIDTQRTGISPLHTHDGTGVIHIESPVTRQFSLAEFFSEWQVGLSSEHIGGLRAEGGKVVRVFVNGTPQTGNPAAITLGAHEEIAVVYGVPRPGQTIPSTYNFSEGD